MKEFIIDYVQVYVSDGLGREIKGPRATTLDAGCKIAREVEQRDRSGMCRVARIKDSFYAFESVEEYLEMTEKERIKKIALAKLTEEEKRALGF